MGSRSGSETEFKDMVKRCNNVGVRYEFHCKRVCVESYKTSYKTTGPFCHGAWCHLVIDKGYVM